MLLFTQALAGPLAIPAGGEPTFTPPAPLAAPEALASYRERAASVRRYTTLAGGAPTSVGFGWGWPGFGAPSVGFSTSYLMSTPTYEVDHWAVYSGGRRLTVPEWMDLADAPVQRDELRRKINTTKAWHHVFLGLCAAGAVGVVGAAWGGQSAESYDELTDWRWVQAGASTALVGGIVGAFSTRLHTRTLRYDFDRTQDLGETQVLVRQHNDTLRAELGLTEAQTEAIDQGQ